MSAQSDYKAAAAALEKFCNEETNFAVEILTENYVGQSTRVLSTLRFKMDAKLMKKMIKLSEKVGQRISSRFPRRCPVCARGNREGDGSICRRALENLHPRYVGRDIQQPQIQAGAEYRAQERSFRRRGKDPR